MALVPNHVEVARVLQGRLHDLEAGNLPLELREVLEITVEEFGFDGYECVYNSKRRKTSLREEAVCSSPDVGEAQSCGHFCCEHKEVMNPGHWGTLPHDLLKLVFAHLPLNDIHRLRCLSKDWKRTVPGDSDLLRLCDQERPKLFALIRKAGFFVTGPENEYLLRVFDMKLNTWHVLKFFSGNPKAGYKLVPGCREMSCEDGGLVRFSLPAATRMRAAFRSLFYSVVNPLTGRSRDLPPVLNVRDGIMKHIMVNRETNCYKVLIVVNKRGEEDTQPPDDIQVRV